MLGLADITKHDIITKMASKLQLPISVLGNGSVSYARLNFPCEGNRSHPNQETNKAAAPVETLTALGANNSDVAYTEPTWDPRETGERAIEVELPELHGSMNLQCKLHALILEFRDMGR
jgi:hypothetical protein